jgi:coproporphyrinogen III oxidase
MLISNKREFEAEDRELILFYEVAKLVINIGNKTNLSDEVKHSVVFSEQGSQMLYQSRYGGTNLHFERTGNVGLDTKAFVEVLCSLVVKLEEEYQYAKRSQSEPDLRTYSYR